MKELQANPSEYPPIFAPEPISFEMKPGNDDFLDDLQKLIDLFEKLYNERHCGLYMTNEEVLKLVGKRLQILYRWDYGTRSYHKYAVPAEWKVYVGGADMSQIINCAGCGKELPMGEAFASLEIHTKMGFGYGVCKECNDKEHERKDRGEADDLP